MATVLEHISRRGAMGAASILLVLVVVFFSATRTEIGREAVARQLEDRFASSTSGTLEIGELTGNLVQTFTATRVRVKDANGRVLVSVDTVTVRPSWDDILRRRFDAPRISLFSPRVHLVDRDFEDLRRVVVDSTAGGGGAWAFQAARLIVQNGRVTSITSTDSVAAVTLAREINLDARIESDPSGYLINLLSASAFAPQDDVRLIDASIQAVVDSSRWVVNQGYLRTGNSEIRAAGWWAPEGFSLEVPASSVSFDEVRALFPGLDLHGQGTISATAAGSISDFVVSEVRLSTGSSSVSVSGTVGGWPDSAAVDLRFSATPVRGNDLRRLIPGLDLPGRLALDSLAAEAYLTGTPLNRVRGEGTAAVDITVTGDAGEADFAGDLRVGPNNQVALTGNLETRAVDLGAVYLTSVGNTSITSALALQAEGNWQHLSLDSLSVAVEGTVQRSRIGASRIDLAQLDASMDASGGSATASLLQLDGETQATLAWRSGEARRLTVNVAASGLDIGALTGTPGLRTRIHGGLSAELAGTSIWDGSVSAWSDSAIVRKGGLESVVGPQDLTVQLAPGESVSTLVVEGSHLNGRMETDVHPAVLTRTARFWARSFADATQREIQKPYGAADLLADAEGITAAVLRNDLQDTAPTGVSMSGTLDLGNMAQLTAWLPGLDLEGADLRASFGFRADPDTFSGRLDLDIPGLSAAHNGVYGATAGFTLASSFEGPVEDAVDFSARVEADSLTTRLASLPDASISVTLREREGTLRAETARGSAVGPVRLAADALLLRDRARIRLDTLAIAARQLDWHTVGSSELEVFSDAVVVSDFVLSEDTESQRLEIDGAFSPEPSDTLRVRALDLHLADLTEFGQLRRKLAGSMTADIDLTGGFARPRTSGSARVPALAMDTWLLGDLQLETRLSPESDHIFVDVSLLPSPLPARVPSSLDAVENRLNVAGTVRPAAGDDPGAWNLTADIERADMFFLGYIFNTSIDRFHGYSTGSGAITGAFSSPTFEANLDVRDGAFGVPLIGANYTLEGSLRVDREAIHIQDAVLVDQDGGSATISGPMYFNDYRFFSFDLTGNLNDLLVMNRGETLEVPFYGEIRGTGTALLSGPLTNATLRIPDGLTRADSELFIPLTDAIEEGDASFIIFADSTGQIPDLQRLIRRPFVLARRATAERQFLDGLNMDLNIEAPRGSLIRLVIDPLLGDVINAESTGRVQIRRNQGEFEVFGQMEVLGGDYLFTAGEVFVRRFLIEPGGTISWLGDPINARLDIPASYRTRASTTGLKEIDLGGALIPLVVQLNISGQVLSPAVDLGLTIDRSNQNALGDYQALEARLNQPDRATEYATSVLLTNSFQLTTDNLTAGAGEQLAFNSVSQLVSSQLSRFLDAALPNVDFNFGLQGERAEDLDITYGVALRLLDERLIIRGEGVYQGSSTDNTRATTQGIQGEFIVEVRLSPSVSAQVFFRREGDIIQNADLTNTAGAGLTYQTDFPSWRRVFQRLFGRDKEPTQTLTSGGDGS